MKIDQTRCKPDRERGTGPADTGVGWSTCVGGRPTPSRAQLGLALSWIVLSLVVAVLRMCEAESCSLPFGLRLCLPEWMSFPHTCFLFSFMHKMWRQTHIDIER